MLCKKLNKIIILLWCLVPGISLGMEQHNNCFNKLVIQQQKYSALHKTNHKILLLLKGHIRNQKNVDLIKLLITAHTEQHSFVFNACAELILESLTLECLPKLQELPTLLQVKCLDQWHYLSSRKLGELEPVFMWLEYVIKNKEVSEDQVHELIKKYGHLIAAHHEESVTLPFLQRFLNNEPIQTLIKNYLIHYEHSKVIQQLTLSFKDKTALSAIGFCPDNSCLAFIKDQKIALFNTITRQLTYLFHGQNIVKFVWKSSNELIAIDSNNSAFVMDITTGKKINHSTKIPYITDEIKSINTDNITIPVPNNDFSIKSSENNGKLILQSYYKSGVPTDSPLKVYDDEDKQLLELSLSNDGTHIAANYGSSIDLWIPKQPGAAINILEGIKKVQLRKCQHIKF